MLSLLGCSRQYYRKQADREAYKIVDQASDDPRWALKDFTIELDPRSRYHDPYDPDNPPMPPDDPSSHRLMHCVDCKKGWEHWHKGGDRPQLENPSWRAQLGQYMELTEQGAVKLGLEEAVRLALIHSPPYQQQLEALYLSAIDVSTERFRLDTQFFAGNDSTFVHTGSERRLAGETMF